MGRTDSTEPQCLYSTAIPLLPSVPVQYSYTSTPTMSRTACADPQCLYSTAIPLLPLWTVRPVQSLSACTRVHFTFTFTLLDTFRGGLYKLSSCRRENQIHVSAGSSSTVASQASLLTD